MIWPIAMKVVMVVMWTSARAPLSKLIAMYASYLVSFLSSLMLKFFLCLRPMVS